MSRPRDGVTPTADDVLSAVVDWMRNPEQIVVDEIVYSYGLSPYTVKRLLDDLAGLVALSSRVRGMARDQARVRRVVERWEPGGGGDDRDDG